VEVVHSHGSSHDVRPRPTTPSVSSPRGSSVLAPPSESGSTLNGAVVLRRQGTCRPGGTAERGGSDWPTFATCGARERDLAYARQRHAAAGAGRLTSRIGRVGEIKRDSLSFHARPGHRYLVYSTARWLTIRRSGRPEEFAHLVHTGVRRRRPDSRS